MGLAGGWDVGLMRFGDWVMVGWGFMWGLDGSLFGEGWMGGVGIRDWVRFG